ncbi:MAG TPA: carbon monoxide dehydrogenase subunit G [Burkholderiales bacterium]
MTGEQLIPASQQDVWEALNDPDVLKACVPGCESITLVNPNEYQVLMTARVGPVSAKFRGRLSLSDIKPPTSYSLAFEGQGGAAGFAKGGAQVKLVPEKEQTRLVYDVKANVGGKLAQIGSRLVDAAAKKVADEFFKNFNDRMSAAEDETVVMHPEPAHGHGGTETSTAALPTVSNTTLIFFAAGSLVVFVVALVTLLG